MRVSLHTDDSKTILVFCFILKLAAARPGALYLSDKNEKKNSQKPSLELNLKMKLPKTIPDHMQIFLKIKNLGSQSMKS